MSIATVFGIIVMVLTSCVCFIAGHMRGRRRGLADGLMEGRKERNTLRTLATAVTTALAKSRRLEYAMRIPGHRIQNTGSDSVQVLKDYNWRAVFNGMGQEAYLMRDEDLVQRWEEKLPPEFGPFEDLELHAVINLMPAHELLVISRIADEALTTLRARD